MKRSTVGRVNGACIKVKNFSIACEIKSVGSRPLLSKKLKSGMSAVIPMPSSRPVKNPSIERMSMRKEYPRKALGNIRTIERIVPMEIINEGSFIYICMYLEPGSEKDCFYSRVLAFYPRFPLFRLPKRNLFWQVDEGINEGDFQKSIFFCHDSFP